MGGAPVVEPGAEGGYDSDMAAEVEVVGPRPGFANLSWLGLKNSWKVTGSALRMTSTTK